MKICSIFILFVAALTNNEVTAVESKTSRNIINFFDPVLSANAYVGHVKENERVINVEPALNAFDADRPNSPNGKICGYELSWHKHDEVLNEVTEKMPFFVEMVNNQAVLKLQSDFKSLDCESRSTFRLFIRAFDCATTAARRYSERSSLTITVEDVNEYAPVFTHHQYLFKLHQDETCDASACRVEATDDDCSNAQHQVCGYEIITPNVPFTIDQMGSISITKKLSAGQYEFDVVARDCDAVSDPTKAVSQPAHVIFKIIPDCSPRITDDASQQLTVQADRIHLFDTVRVNTCEETCQVEDIVATVTLDSHGLDSGCNSDQCLTVNREYVLLPKDLNFNSAPRSEIRTFDGLANAMVIKKTDFPGHFSDQFTIRMWMKHGDEQDNTDKHHVFCKSDEKLKNRHHTALFIQNNQLKLLLRKGPVVTNDKNVYESEWIWKIPQVSDNQWHSYRLVVKYPTKIELYIDEKLFVQNEENFQVIKDYALPVIDGTEDTIFALGACWHARATRMVQHFRGQLSGLSIEQNEELQRSSTCVQDCQQFIDIVNLEKEKGMEFASNANRSMWILRSDSVESYERLLKNFVYRNKFQPLGPVGQRTVSIQTQVKCLGEGQAFRMPVFTRSVSIEAPVVLPNKVEMKAESSYLVPDNVMSRGIYLFRNLSIYTNAVRKSQVDIRECTLNTNPALVSTEQLIVPETKNLEIILTKNGARISGFDSIDKYQYVVRQIAFISKAPVKYVERLFALSCLTGRDGVVTNEIHVRVQIHKQIPPPAPVAAALSSRLEVNNDHIQEALIDTDNGNLRTTRNGSDWPIAVVICVAVGLAGVFVLYILVRARSSKRQNNLMAIPPDEIHPQMEWEDDLGLNITVNPLDETKKPVPNVNMHSIGQTMNSYSGASSDDDEYDQDGHNRNEYSSEDDEEEEFEHEHTRKAKIEHQLEWDDAAIEYGPKKV